MAENSGESIATSLRLTKSLNLARQGRLREAQQLLAAEGTLPENPLELHALAALATGDGDYARAQRLWRLLLQREPGHAEAKRMIDAIDLWQSRPSWFQYLPIGGMVAAVGILIGVFAWALSDDPPPPPRATPAPAVYRAPVSAPQPVPVAPIAMPESRRARNR